MKTVFEVLTQAFNSDLIDNAILLDVVIFFLYGFNIALGTIIGTKTDKFNIKKFIFGLIKAVLVLLIIVGVCYILNVFTLTVNRIDGLQIDSKIITTIELLGIMISVGAELSAEVVEKIKSFKELKYNSYEDNKPIVNNIDMVEPEELRG